ncbi:MAG: hypothetical protein HOB79_04180 [Rhodospirillaceae bacterium]|nr:hypothetical protein [Rhodospirillaceae bacterium]MBT4700250.1 hypothetical protein [Rhodospirillaceae bacterium]MBT5034755.1 hypothetical protein [Rhodospirillaceae bacterium]MBT6363247.1 hypothetical protein [Rhodospirillaceae bacterium]MBT7772003.1 hypothetical protein [Rhodospirillales bacterium]
MAKLGKHLFTFAVIADTHMNQSEDYSSSPYPANALANARTRRVIAELNLLKPEFVVHLGDIVNPVPELPTYAEAAGHFKSQIANLDAPYFVVPGNHDVGDKPVSWMPAGTVTDEFLDIYRSHFGDDYFSFDQNGLHIIILNASIINSGLESEEMQRKWLEADLAVHEDARTFICIHYPPYISNRDENSSYDNIDEPGRTWLLDLIKTYKPEAMFCGHVHNFWYDVVGETEIYLLPSTAFVRHDYSEFFKIEPGDQFGRNDEPKLGYFRVRVYEHGHVVENLRTYGRTLDEGDSLTDWPPTAPTVQPKESTITSVGLDMRHPWAEELEIAPSGAVDEFERKRARNDYPVLALWEMGVRRLRVPVQDLVDPRIRRRMEILTQAGHVFQVYCYGVPTGKVLEAITAHAALIHVLEIVIVWEDVAKVMPKIADLKTATGVPIYLSRVNRKDAGKFEGARFNHLISHGFVFAELQDLMKFIKETKGTDAIDGFMFKINNDVCPIAAAREAMEINKFLGRIMCLYIRTSGSSPAEAFMDEAENTTRFAKALIAAVGTAAVEVTLDTFADSDRGYFARAGLVDRRYNPKLGSHVIKHLMGLLSGDEWVLEEDVLKGSDGRRVVVEFSGESSIPDNATDVEWIDLETGKVHREDPPTMTGPCAISYLES